MRRIAPLAVLMVVTVATATASDRPPGRLTASPRPPSSPQQTALPVFRTGVDLVRLDVRVTDADGRPVTDLRPDEIRVVEQGAERPILLFQHVARPLGTYAEIAQRTIASEVSTNQGAPRGHVYVLVFDQAHISTGNEQRARMAAETFLRTRVRPGDRIALYALPGPGPEIPFTADTTQALRELVSVRGFREETDSGALATMRVYEAYEITRGNQEVLGRYVDALSETRAGTDTVAAGARQTLARDQEELPVLRRLVTEDARSVVSRADAEARRFLRALADLLAALRVVDGRKAVVLFSEGFEVDNVTTELEQVAAAAARSYSVVYGIDLNVRAMDVSQATPIGGQVLSEVQSRLQSLGSLTAETDGELFIDATPRLESIMTRIGETTEDYYLVGFAPSETALRDREQYRRVEVSVTRPGAHVSTRSGYVAGAEPTPADRRQAVTAALGAPFTQQGLRVDYTTYQFSSVTPGAERVFLSLESELPVATGAGQTADVVFAVRDARDGRLAASGADEIALPEASQAGSPTGVGHYRVQFEVPPGVYLMRVVVREPGGLLGSTDRRFAVRPLGGPSVTASDLLIGSSNVSGLPVRATVDGADVLSGVFELYAESVERLETVEVDVELLVPGTADPVVTTRAALAPIAAGATGASRGAQVRIPLDGVPAGPYVVRAIVRTGQETAAELLRDVVVERSGTAAGPSSSTPSADSLRQPVRPPQPGGPDGHVPGATP